jgi:hypothetical protein
MGKAKAIPAIDPELQFAISAWWAGNQSEG